MDIKELETKIETLEAQNKEFAEKLTGLEEENKNLKAEKEASEKSLAEFKETTKRNEFGAWYDGIVKAGKALPANKEATVNTMMILDGQEAMDFSEGEKTVKKTPLELFKSQAEAAEKVVEYSEFAEKNKAKTRDASTQEKEFQEKISKRMKEASLEYGEAMRQVTMENPELAEAVERNAYE